MPAPVEHRLLQVQYAHAGILVVHHASVRRRLLDEFDLDPDRIVVNPLPISVEETVPRADGARPTVLFFGTFRRNKGVDVLLRAIASLRDETDARFHFAGRGFPEVEAEVMAAAALDDRITTEIGYATAPRKRELYADADLVVLPYTSFASQSAVLQDAYAHHVPLIVSDVGALGETVREDRSGWVVTPGDVAGLAKTLLAAIRDDAGRHAAAAEMERVAAERTPGSRRRDVARGVRAGRGQARARRSGPARHRPTCRCGRATGARARARPSRAGVTAPAGSRRSGRTSAR